MSYAQKPTSSEELQGRLGDALSRWTKSLATTLRRALFKPRSITILDVPAGSERLQPARMSVIPKADAWHRADRADHPLPPPLP